MDLRVFTLYKSDLVTFVMLPVCMYICMDVLLASAQVFAYILFIFDIPQFIDLGVTCFSDYIRGLDWSVDLLTAYRSSLQITMTQFFISTIQITPR
jgi:hypothetical protein